MIEWLRHNDRLSYALYAGVALAVMLPLLAPGFVLTLDMVFVPHMHPPTDLRASYPFYLLLYVLNQIMPGDVLQKILLFIILFAAGIGMHRLVRWVLRDKSEWRYAAYFAGLLYVVNPFVYDRLMAGQFAVLLGYMLLPFLVRSALVLAAHPRIASALAVGVWLTLMGIVSLHGLGLAVVLLMILMALAMWRHDNRAQLAKCGALTLAIFIVLSSYWLVPLIAGRGSMAEEISGFGTIDRQAFATIGGNVAGMLGNAVRLQGFWAEARDLFVLPQEFMPGWGLVALAVIALAVAGGVWAWRQGQRFVLAISGLAIAAGIVLTIGVGNDWLALHIPFFAGFREPQKFVALVAFGYALLGGFGALALVRRLRRAPTWLATVGMAMVFVLPILYAPTLLWGAQNQLSPRQYPSDWFGVDATLRADRDTFRVLFLPWHQYMNFGFAGRIIVNPAPQFFAKPVIASDNPEFGGLPPSGDALATQFDKNVMPTAATNQVLAYDLAGHNVKYIMLAKDYDYRSYDYLDHRPGLEPVIDTPTLRVYLNKEWKGDSQ